MAGVVFSAKRKSIEIEFVFRSGQTANFTYLAKTQQELEDDMAYGASNAPNIFEGIAYGKQRLKERLVCDDELKEHIIKEVIDTSSIGDFEDVCEGAIRAAKKQK